jgi:RNA polymerase sigma factor for flagellar operon FliA
MVPATSTSSPTRLSTEHQRLVREHLGLVQHMLLQVSRRLPAHVDRGNLYGAGAAALVDAGRRFDASSGVEFPAFATKRVRGAMLDELRHWDWAPRSVRTQNRRRIGALEALTTELGREPRAAEVATALGITVDHLRRTESDIACATLGSLQVLEAKGVHALAASTTTPLDVLVAREVREYVRDAVNTLPERERHAVVGYFLQERPMRDLAAELGVTESRVSQLCKQGLALLRERLAPYLFGQGTPIAPATAARSLGRHSSAASFRPPWTVPPASRPLHAGDIEAPAEPTLLRAAGWPSSPH